MNIVFDLNLYNDILPKLDNCITTYGSTNLRNMMTDIIYDYDELIERQKILLSLKTLKDTKKYKKIKELLHAIKDHRKNIDSWFDDYSYYNMISSYDSLNSSMYLDMMNKAQYISVFLIFTIYILIYVYLRYTGVFVSFYDYLQSIYLGYVKTVQYIVSYVVPHEITLISIAHATAVVYVIYQLISYYTTFWAGIEHYNNCELFKKKFNKIREILCLSEKIIDMSEVFKIPENVKDLIAELKLRFDYDNQKLGDYILIQHERDLYKDKFFEILDHIGKLDAYICIAELISDKSNGYSVPIFIKADKPMVHIENVWNPAISYDDNILNDFSPLENHLMLITGPNKAGKSTYMKSAFLALYLSQTVGISCSSQTIMTPFKYFFTYLNVPDTVGRESLFEAELNRMYDYYNTITSLYKTKNCFAFSIIDELFTGTNPQEGLATSFAICKYLSTNNNSINVVSTHFTDICNKIVAHKQAQTVNEPEVSLVKFTAYKDDNDRYKFLYKAEEGISNQHIAIDLLKERGYCKEILDQAYSV